MVCRTVLDMDDPDVDDMEWEICEVCLTNNGFRGPRALCPSCVDTVEGKKAGRFTDFYDEWDEDLYGSLDHWHCN